jgi:hypothetical protein
MSLDGNSQTMKFVQPDILNRSSLSVGKNDGLAHKFGLRVPKRDEDRRRAEIHNCHGVPKVGRFSGILLHSKDVQVVTGTGQTSVGASFKNSSLIMGATGSAPMILV